MHKKSWFRNRIIHTSGILASKSQRSAWSSCAFSLRFPDCFPLPRPSVSVIFPCVCLCPGWATCSTLLSHHCNSFMISVVPLPIGTYLYLTGYGVWFRGTSRRERRLFVSHLHSEISSTLSCCSFTTMDQPVLWAFDGDTVAEEVPFSTYSAGVPTMSSRNYYVNASLIMLWLNPRL